MATVRWGWLGGCVAGGVLTVSSLAGQAVVTHTDLNPSQSTLDATNPSGASSGRINGLARAPNGTDLFAASEWGGLYQSTDRGRTWIHLAGHVPMVTWDVAVDPTHANRVYATSFYDGRTSSIAGINVSTDGGTTWTHPASAAPPAGFCVDAARRDNPSAFGIAIDPANSDHVFVGTNCGLAISTDAGVTWSFVDPTPTDGADDIWDVVVHDGGMIDLCGDDGHRRSTDGGVTFTPTTTSPASGRCSIAVSPDEADVLLMVAGTTIYESDDGGSTWPYTLTNPNAQGRVPFVVTNKRAGSDWDLWFGDVWLTRATCTTPAAGASGRRCPANAWTSVSAGAHADAGAVVFAPGVATDACPVLFSSDGGVYRNTTTTSPACHTPTWEQPDRTPHALWLMTMAGVNQAGAGAEDLYFGAQDNGSYATRDGDQPTPMWANQDFGDVFDVIGSATRSLLTICCYVNQAPLTRMFVRSPGLIGGAAVGTYPPGSLPYSDQPDGLVFLGGESYGALTTSGVFVTPDITASPVVWNQVGAGSAPSGCHSLMSAEAAGTESFLVLCGGGTSDDQNSLWRFSGTAAGGTWSPVATPLGSGGFGVAAVDPHDPDHIIASYLRTNLDPAMVMTDDGGVTWNPLPALDARMSGNGVFRLRNVRGPSAFTNFSGYQMPTLVAFDPFNSATIVAGGAESGVFLSRDGGTTWELLTDPIAPQTSGIPHLPRPRYAYITHDGSTLFAPVLNIFVGTQGRGVWRITWTNPPTIVDVCGVRVHGCREPEMLPEHIDLDCRAFALCRFADPLPRNCLLKYPCPGCDTGGLCPPVFHLVFEDLDPTRWDFAVFARDGTLVPATVTPLKRGVVVSFQPEKELYRDRSIGDYRLVIARTGEVTPRRYRMRARVFVGEYPFDARGKLREGARVRPGGPPPLRP
jgi:hypothetical protein